MIYRSKVDHKFIFVVLKPNEFTAAVFKVKLGQ